MYVCVDMYVYVCMDTELIYIEILFEIYVIYVYRCSRFILIGRPFCQTFFQPM